MNSYHLYLLLIMIYLPIEACFGQSSIAFLQKLEASMIDMNKSDSLEAGEKLALQQLIDLISKDSALMKRYDSLANRNKHVMVRIFLTQDKHSIIEEYYDADSVFSVYDGNISRTAFYLPEQGKGDIHQQIARLYPRNYVKHKRDSISIIDKYMMKIHSAIFRLIHRKSVKEEYIILDCWHDVHKSAIMMTVKVPVCAKRKLIFVIGQFHSGPSELESWIY